jgi:hypothetical protein
METIFKNFKNLKKVKDLLWACRKRRTWDHLVIHRRKLTENPPDLIIPLLCGHVKGKLSCPPELTILLVHNHGYETLMEKSLRYVGIENFTVVRPPINGPWIHTVKISAVLNYLKTGACKTEYLLYCDSNDAILRDDPRKAIRYLEEENCELLFSKTRSRKVYHYFPNLKVWTDQVAKEHGYPGWYINAGVFVGRTFFLREVLEAAMAYITETDLPGAELRRIKYNGTLYENLPDFPKGCGCDQTILRYLHPKFYPRMKIDYKGRLALR